MGMGYYSGVRRSGRVDLVLWCAMGIGLWNTIRNK